jgi:hypothetical protein
MVVLNELEKIEEKIALDSISGKPTNIEINERTLIAYREEFAKKGLVIEQHKDYPMHETGFKMVKRMKKFDSLVVPEKGIKKIISAMTRQPVTTCDTKGKPVTRDAVYYYGRYEGFDRRDNQIACNFAEGWFLRPKIRFTLTDPSHPYDSTTGERKGSYAVAGTTYEHYIFLSEDKKERRKQLEDIVQKATGTFAGNLEKGGHLSFRQPHQDNNHSGGHGGMLTWNQFCDLSLKEGLELQDKSYYKEYSTGILKDKDGLRVEYNRSTGKLEAIK